MLPGKGAPATSIYGGRLKYSRIHKRDRGMADDVSDMDAGSAAPSGHGARESARWPPTFNVIYLPGTVDTLFMFVRSLAEHSSYRFRLVSNACTAREEAFLADEASSHPGLEFVSLETKTIISHGEALQRLFRGDRADYFACIDSDIFARGPFLTGAQSLLRKHAALSTGLVAWMKPEERVMPGHFVFMSGRFSHMDDGRCLGVSYCAVYRRAEVEKVMGRTGVTFHSRRWPELSPEQRALLSTMKLEMRRYDTMKLVNLMLEESGLSLAMCSEPNLVHVGALSNVAVRPMRLPGRIIARLRDIVQSSWPGPVPRRRSFERRTTLHVYRRRQMAEDYFRHLLAGGSADGGPARSFPAGGRQQLVEMGDAFLALRRRYQPDDGAEPPSTSRKSP
jgi:hypothetical protein